MKASLRRRVHVVVLAGGAGERFWPASRRSHPKPFLRVVGGKTLLGATLSRARRLAPRDQVWIVGGKEHATALRKESGLAPSRVLIEPERRNTAMACAWAALRIQAEDPNAILVILPADHHIPDERAFAADLAHVVEAADAGRVLTTIGVVPTRPDTGYGYIEIGPKVGAAHPGVHRVARFVEKPDARRAARYVASGRHAWNAGIFAWRADVFLEDLARHEPPIHRALAALRRKPKGRNRKELETSYRRAPSVPVDVAVLERSDRVWTWAASFAWSDVGTWQSLADELGVGTGKKKARRGEEAVLEWLSGPGSGRAESADAESSLGNRVVSGEVLALDADSNLILGGKRLIALVGVDQLAVIDTDDVILVTKLDRGQDVRSLVKELNQSGRRRLT